MYRGHEGYREFVRDPYDSVFVGASRRVLGGPRPWRPTPRDRSPPGAWQGKAAPRPSRPSATSSSSRTARLFGFANTSTPKKPSKPPGLRSRAQLVEAFFRAARYSGLRAPSLQKRRRDTARAMSQENVEIVRRFYRAWARRRVPGTSRAYRDIHEDVEYGRSQPAGSWSRGLGRDADAAFSRAVDQRPAPGGSPGRCAEPEQILGCGRPGGCGAWLERSWGAPAAAALEVEGRESGTCGLVRDGKAAAVPALVP